MQPSENNGFSNPTAHTHPKPLITPEELQQEYTVDLKWKKRSLPSQHSKTQLQEKAFYFESYLMKVEEISDLPEVQISM
jgi:hypothetical protein